MLISKTHVGSQNQTQIVAKIPSQMPKTMAVAHATGKKEKETLLLLLVLILYTL